MHVGWNKHYRKQFSLCFNPGWGSITKMHWKCSPANKKGGAKVGKIGCVFWGLEGIKTEQKSGAKTGCTFSFANLCLLHRSLEIQTEDRTSLRTNFSAINLYSRDPHVTGSLVSLSPLHRLSHEVSFYHPPQCLQAAYGDAGPAQTGRATYCCHDRVLVKHFKNTMTRRHVWGGGESEGRDKKTTVLSRSFMEGDSKLQRGEEKEWKKSICDLWGMPPTNRLHAHSWWIKST